MKEQIIKLKFKKDHETKMADFFIDANANENDEVLDISIHHTNPSKSGEGKKQKLNKEMFFFGLNNRQPRSINYTENVIFLPDKGVKGEAIYQFSIPFKDILIGADNSVVIYGKDLQNEVGSVEFFAEKEDNFVNVRLDRPGNAPTSDQVLWSAIKENLQFDQYVEFINAILCGPGTISKGTKDYNFNDHDRTVSKSRSPFVRSNEYNLVKFGTEFFMLKKFGLDTEEIKSYIGNSNMLPYYALIEARIADDFFDKGPEGDIDCYNTQQQRLLNPFMIELIWSYWMEQAGLVQTLNIINLRFQNIKTTNLGDRLQRLDIDPLRPLSHILWGYIQDEQHRLSIPRRLNEYDHEYGLILTGKAVPPVRSIDPRVPFLEAFHNLLNQCIAYFHESDDTTRIADAFPILNSLKEVHLLLAEGNHNAYGNLTWTARHEMMMQQYILSRPEMRDFLGGRTMVPYPETWMDRVDNMRSIQGWGGAGVMYYYELAVHGEQILLSIRYGNWSDITLRGENAANWAKEFRNSIQRYVHAYRAVTGVDLSVEKVQMTDNNYATQPAFLIQQRMAPNNNVNQRKLPSPLFRM